MSRLRRRRRGDNYPVNVVVLGGTRFIGPYVVRLLAAHGHDVTIVHRGATETELPQAVRHVHIPFARLPEELGRLRSKPVDVVLDVVPYLDKGGHGVFQFAGTSRRGVVITSVDVYRAYARLWRSEPGPPDPMPLTEESPLRSLRVHDAGSEEIAFDNIEVENAVRDGPLPVTILRLPATYGPNDPQHRLHRYLKRMDDNRPVIVLEEQTAHWRWARGYVENVAGAIALAVEDERAAGRVYNVAETTAYAEADWVRRVGKAAGWSGDVVAIPQDELPERLRQKNDASQHYVVDSTRIRSELGYRERIDEATALDRTIEWERRNPPASAPAPDYAAEDEAVAALGQRKTKR